MLCPSVFSLHAYLAVSVAFQISMHIMGHAQSDDPSLAFLAAIPIFSDPSCMWFNRFDEFTDTWQCLFCILALHSSLAGYHVNFLGLAPELGPRDLSQRLGNVRAIHLGGFSGPGVHSGPISGHFRRFRARPPICDLNTVTLPQLRLLRHQNCVLRQQRCLFLQQKTSVLSQQQTSVLSQQQTSVLSQQKTSILSQPVSYTHLRAHET